MEEVLIIAMAALGLLGGSGGAGSDLVSLLPTDTYFQSRRIPMNIENLEDLARSEPKDGKAQILQLMALCALAENPELTRSDSAAIRRTIEKIAKGEIAKDRLGFSEEYATRTLLALGSKITRPKGAQPAELAEEALGWFPASTTLVGFLGGGPLTDSTGDYGIKVRSFLSKLVRRPRDWDGFFNAVEMIGNARIDRIGFAYVADGKHKEKHRLYVRITGKGDHQRIIAAFKTAKNDVAWKENKDAKGRPITTMHDGSNGPAVAVVGDTDLLLGTYAVGRGSGDHVEVIQQLLAVRAGKEKSVLKGALQERQPKLSQQTVGLLVGDLPEELRAPFLEAKLPAPKSIRVDGLRASDGVHVRFHATLGNGDEAKRFAESVPAIRQAGLDSLKRIQEGDQGDTLLPRGAFASLRKALESLQAQPEGTGVKGAISVPTEALLPALWLELRHLGLRRSAAVAGC